ncbi:ACP5, partial [Symbiodinium pilosum]
FHVALASALASLTYALEPLKADLSAVEELAAKTKKVEDEGEKKEEHPFITYYPDEFQYTSTYCKPLDAPENENCSAHVKWGFEHGKTGDATAKKLYEKLHYWTSMNPDKASMDDYHKFYYCAPPDEKQKCGQPPCHCSYPPCHMCHFPERPRGCTKDSTDMRCKPPQKAMDYNGWAWPDVKIKGKGPYHVFAIGDWGGMDTMLPPVEGRDPLMPWKGYGLPKP